MPKKNHMNFTEFFVGSASQAVPHVRDNESKGTSTIVSGAPKWSLVISLDPTVVEVVILIDKDTLKMCKMTRTWLLERCFCQQWRGQPQDLEVLEAFRIWKSGSLDITELTDNTSFFGNPFFKAGTWHHSRGPTFHNAVCVCVCTCVYQWWSTRKPNWENNSFKKLDHLTYRDQIRHMQHTLFPSFLDHSDNPPFGTSRIFQANFKKP